MHARATEMLPIRACLAIAQKKPSIVEPARPEMVHPAAHHGDRTDPALANRSKGDHSRFSCRLALGHVVIDEVLFEQGQGRRVPLYDENRIVSSHQAAAQRIP